MEQKCVFCDRSQFEERLVGENESFYVIATLGQITDGGYVLLVPKKHLPCIGVFSSDELRNLIDLCEKTELALIAEYGLNHENGGVWPVTTFEHGLVGQTIKHAHLHLLPAVLNLSEKIRRDFPTAEIDAFSYPDDFRETYCNRPEPYLLWTENAAGNVCWNPPAPLQYLRIIAAEALGRPERSNWRTMDPELDKQLWSETVRRLKPYFS